MTLEKYHAKRKFSKTPEPAGRGKESKKSGNIFVVQKHQARNLHYDFRLASDGVLKSWAVPKKPPLKAGLKRLAMQVEDHPLAYAKFRGEIPKGQYGAGMVEIWDSGTYETINFSKTRWEFKLTGKKLKGIYFLIKFPRASENAWLFFKKKGG